MRRQRQRNSEKSYYGEIMSWSLAPPRRCKIWEKEHQQKVSDQAKRAIFDVEDVVDIPIMYVIRSVPIVDSPLLAIGILVGLLKLQIERIVTI